MLAQATGSGYTHGGSVVQGGGGCCRCITAKIVFSSCFVPITSGSIAPCFPGKQGGHAGGACPTRGVVAISERVIALPVEIQDMRLPEAIIKGRVC